MFKPAANGVMFVGLDPAGRDGVIKKLITEFTVEQVAALSLIDPATALIYFDPVKIASYTPPPIDNQPGAPLPKLVGNDESKESGNAKAAKTFKKPFSFNIGNDRSDSADTHN
jgi:hypothetical protein